ncbi:hypothetical protein FPG3_07130 [Flavobacterium psychrophilum FPG3]|nr:hypothetical protein FPG3_07130 [Flavobacterium psychrophilum FPG3]OXB08174.1 hypothetical protein B0A57_11220 [Flavobacterium psychrophilum DSM 3660 = ATCC 49418]
MFFPFSVILQIIYLFVIKLLNSSRSESIVHNEPPLCGGFERACSRRKSSKAGDGRTSCESNDGFSSPA